MVNSNAFEPERLLLHASLITTVAIGLVTVLSFLSKWMEERAREKAQKANLERAQQWLSKRGLSEFPGGGRNSFMRLLEQRVKHDKQEWDVTFTNVTTSPSALSVSLLGVLDEGHQLLMWTDVVRIKEKVVELQVTAAHPTLGRMGCSLSIQNLHLRFKATVSVEDDGVYLSIQFLMSPDIAFRVTKKHPIGVALSTLDSLTQCLQKELTSLILRNVPLLQSTATGQVVGGSHGNGAVERSPSSKRPTDLPQLTSQEPAVGSIPSNVEIIVQTATPSSSMKNALEEQNKSTTLQGAVGNENTDSGTPSYPSNSPVSPSGQWRRTRSYEKLDFIDVMPPPPPVSSPTRVYKHSTSLVTSAHNGSLSEEAGHKLDTPRKTPKKRPVSAAMLPLTSAGSVSGTTSESDAWSAVTESSEDLSVTSASDVSMIVYEFKDGVGSPKHIVVDKASKPHIKRPPHSLKLHVYNGHTFVATHFKRFKNSVGPLTCSSCKKRVHGVVGKQAYQCRDCKMIVHKGCHSLVPLTCPQSTVESMNLIYMDSRNTI